MLSKEPREPRPPTSLDLTEDPSRDPSTLLTVTEKTDVATVLAASSTAVVVEETAVRASSRAALEIRKRAANVAASVAVAVADSVAVDVVAVAARTNIRAAKEASRPKVSSPKEKEPEAAVDVVAVEVVADVVDAAAHVEVPTRPAERPRPSKLSLIPLIIQKLFTLFFSTLYSLASTSTRTLSPLSIPRPTA